MLFAECGPFCALQACCEGLQVEIVMPEIDIFVSSTGIITLDHKTKFKNNTFVRNNRHNDNEFDYAGTEGRLVSVVCCITPLALQMRRFKVFFALFPDFKEVWSLAASAEMTREVEISTLSAHQMAPAGVVAHTSSWTPAAYELEESSPPLDSHIGGLSEPLDGGREQGDKVVYFLMGLSTGNAASFRSGVVNTGFEDVLVLPAVLTVPCSLFLHFATDARLFWVFGSLFQRRCGAPLASCCGSGNLLCSMVTDRASCSTCRHRRVMCRPRASRSSSHRDER